MGLWAFRVPASSLPLSERPGQDMVEVSCGISLTWPEMLPSEPLPKVKMEARRSSLRLTHSQLGSQAAIPAGLGEGQLPGGQVRLGRGKVWQLLWSVGSLAILPRVDPTPSSWVLAYLPGNRWALEPAHLWLQVSDHGPPTRDGGGRLGLGLQMKGQRCSPHCLSSPPGARLALLPGALGPRASWETKV